jgi:hypothetical protein
VRRRARRILGKLLKWRRFQMQECGWKVAGIRLAIFSCFRKHAARAVGIAEAIG